MAHDSGSQSGCCSCLSGIFVDTSQSARASKLQLVSSPADERDDQRDSGHSGAQSHSSPDDVPPSDSSKKVDASAEQLALAAYKEEYSTWSPEIGLGDRITASVGTASLRGSLSPSDDDTDSDSRIGIRKVKSERIWRNRAHTDHLERLEEFQTAVAKQPGRLQQQVLFDRLEEDMKARALARREAKNSKDRRPPASIKHSSEPLRSRPKTKAMLREDDDEELSAELSQ